MCTCISMSVCVSLVGGWGGSGLAGPRWDTSPSLGCGGLSLTGVTLDTSCISMTRRLCSQDVYSGLSTAGWLSKLGLQHSRWVSAR